MQQTVICPNCGSQNAANQQFCVSCGAHLANSQRPASHVPIVTGVANPTPVMTGMPMQSAMTGMAVQPTSSAQQGQVEVKPTWALAWGLFWRMLFIYILLAGVIFLGYMLVRLILGYNDVFGAW
jgi:hypothetical protein